MKNINLTVAGIIIFSLSLLVLVVMISVPDLPGPWKHTIGKFDSSSDFVIEQVMGSSGQALNKGSRFSYKLGVPISVKGKTVYETTSHIWAVLQDKSELHYLQNPPVKIESDKWLSANIYPLGNITEILFVKVEESGHNFFIEMARKKKFGGFSNLPIDAEIIGSIYIE